MTIEIDHVIVCVPDLVGSVRAFEQRHRVTSVPGGRHDGHGTANRLIPLGDSYVELLAVVDPDEAKESPLGTWATDRAEYPGADAVCLRTDDLEEVCRRLGLRAEAMSRLTPDGNALRWRISGFEHTVSDGLPFFIQWDTPDHLHPGRMQVDHPGGHLALGDVTLFGDVDRLRLWSEGNATLSISGGDPRVSYVIHQAD